MKKISLFTLALLHYCTIALLIIAIILIGAGCKDEKGEEKVAEDGHSYSCNKIESMSRCTDIADSSYWGEQCSSDAVYSEELCPPSSVGGCRTHAGTRKEKTLWHYGYGGDPKTDQEIINFLRRNCEGLTEIDGQWVYPVGQ